MVPTRGGPGSCQRAVRPRVHVRQRSRRPAGRR
ncbi:MAG: hypothetical protein ABGY72_07480 [bacterium]